MSEGKNVSFYNQHRRHHSVIVAITGASGSALGLRIIELLAAEPMLELHVVVSSAGQRTIATEQGPEAFNQLKSLSTYFYDCEDIGATIASGSFPVDGMIVAPCSMHTLAAIANGITNNLIIRAADVQLKERRRLILMTRETPLHLGHLRHMCAVTEIGGVVMPPVPAFYHNPKHIDEIIEDLALRAIALLALPLSAKPRVWKN
ncbi:putative UbiX-like flavin prenyltransferase [Commensalibacter sp. Nvir]|uniref:UbiX family flavin prenyltransferase n=1 Tax=Commensalibacter sp. Nvir TaxID=3069817 RepID=UPI002D3D9D2B|nr:putative UbiX-like flavin prenyltransferase [Commensalibacter sp. Nvir]